MLPDLAGDGPPGSAACRSGSRPAAGPGAVRAVALVLLLAASALLVAGRPPGTASWIAIAGLAVGRGPRGGWRAAAGKVPFLAAIGIAAIDVALFAGGCRRR